MHFSSRAVQLGLPNASVLNARKKSTKDVRFIISRCWAEFKWGRNVPKRLDEPQGRQQAPGIKGS